MSDPSLVLRDILERRDPHGYYVIPIDAERFAQLERYLPQGSKLLQAGDVVFVKTRSRRHAERLTRLASRLGALALEEL